MKSFSRKYRMIIVLLPILGISTLAAFAQTPETEATAANNAHVDANNNVWKPGEYDLERRKVEAEETRVKDARNMVWWTTAPIAIPIILGFVTLFWQAKTAFQLKTAEVLMESKSTRAAKERAQALRKLFPRYVSERFVKVFNTEFKLPGLAYQEKKLELFKALAATVKEKKDVFQLYMMLYADEEATFKDFAANWQMTFEDDSDWIRRSTEKLQKK